MKLFHSDQPSASFQVPVPIGTIVPLLLRYGTVPNHLTNLFMLLWELFPAKGGTVYKFFFNFSNSNFHFFSQFSILQNSQFSQCFFVTPGVLLCVPEKFPPPQESPPAHEEHPQDKAASPRAL